MNRGGLTDNLLFLSVRLEKRKTNNLLMSHTLMTRKKKRDGVVLNDQLQIQTKLIKLTENNKMQKRCASQEQGTKIIF